MKLFLAGAEAHYVRLREVNARHLLFSYLYLRKKGITNLGKAFPELKDRSKNKITVMIDSGAFTFNTHVDEFTKEDCIKYRKKYLEWLEANKDYIDIAVELDFNEHLSVKMWEKWRTKYFVPLEEKTGIKIVYVWHRQLKLSGWKDMCAKYKYVGLAEAGGWDAAQLARYVREAHKHKAKVHGFAFTKPERLIKANMDSCDSTSWIGGMKYGSSYVFTGHKLELFDNTQKHLRNKYRRRFEKAGLDWQKIKKDDYNEVTKLNILGWLDTEAWINKRLRLKKRLHSQTAESQTLSKEQILDINSKTTKLENESPHSVGSTESNTSNSPNSPATVDPTYISLLDLPGVPKLHCASCHISEDCDMFKEDRKECAYKIPEIAFPTSNDAITQVQIGILKVNYQRWQRNVLFEVQSGGYADRTIDAIGANIFSQLQSLKENSRSRFGPSGELQDASSPLTKRESGILTSAVAAILDAKKTEPEPVPVKPMLTIDQGNIEFKKV